MAVVIHAEAQQIIDRLAAVDLASPVRDLPAAERAIVAHYAALGLPAPRI